VRGRARIDAIVLQPLIEAEILADAANHTLALYRSLSASDSSGVLPASGREEARNWDVQTYDRNGALLAAGALHSHDATTGRVPVAAYGYTLAVSSAER